MISAGGRGDFYAWFGLGLVVNGGSAIGVCFSAGKNITGAQAKGKSYPYRACQAQSIIRTTPRSKMDGFTGLPLPWPGWMMHGS